MLLVANKLIIATQNNQRTKNVVWPVFFFGFRFISIIVSLSFFAVVTFAGGICNKSKSLYRTGRDIAVL